MPDEYANYAFISYSHKDEKRAAWIQRKLEAYRLPSVIRKEAGSTVPERIRLFSGRSTLRSCVPSGGSGSVPSRRRASIFVR